MRQDWAAGWARLLAPGAELVTIIFPVGPGGFCLFYLHNTFL
jgi:hypothetical protein